MNGCERVVKVMDKNLRKIVVVDEKREVRRRSQDDRIGGGIEGLVYDDGDVRVCVM